MELNVELSEKFLDRCTREQLLELAESHSIVLTSKDKKCKEDMLSAIKSQLINQGVLYTESEASPGKVLSSQQTEIGAGHKEKQTQFETERLTFEMTQRLKEREWEKQFQLKKLEFEAERERTQVELKKLEYARENEREQREYEMKKLELELELETKKAETSKSIQGVQTFDVGRNLKMVPPFNEHDVDKYFDHFERVATSLEWPKKVWTLLLQCVLIGKAQEVFVTLSEEESADFGKVKIAILRAYELVPEAYRQRFRGSRKFEKQTYVEFAREKEIMFTRWCQSQKVENLDQLRELILVEEFKNCVPASVSTYLNEQKALTIADAAVLADEFVLTHRVSFPDRVLNDQSKRTLRNRWIPPMVPSGSVSSVPPVSKRVFQEKRGKVLCFYCHRAGHKISECTEFKKSVKPVGLVESKFPPVLNVDIFNQNLEHKNELDRVVDVENCEEYAPFITTGMVSLLGHEEEVPVKILRDTGAAQSFLLEGVLPLSDQTATGKDVVIRGIEMTFMRVPLHRVYLKSDLVKGDVIVAVRSSFPVPGVTFILGNDLAQGNVWGTSKMVPATVVIPSPMLTDTPDECGEKFPHVFSSCAVTRARQKQLQTDRQQADEVLLHSGDRIHSEEALLQQATTVANGSSATLKQLDGKEMGGELFGMASTDKGISESSDVFSEESVLHDKRVSTDILSCLLHVSREVLIQEQSADTTLKPLFEIVYTEDDVDVNLSSCYFLRDKLLLRRWVSKAEPTAKAYVQVVIPQKFRQSVVKLAHEGGAEHMGVGKTYDQVQRRFFWPGIKRDVAKFVKHCHVCQITGKPNQKIPVAPLQPISAISKPFEYLLMDCVGPLPRSKAGHSYLLTIMCLSTRYPAAYPISSITTKSVIKALTNFMSTFGIPKVIQTDRGSNFMSRQFARVLQQLKISHNISSAYHPQSQGALERFHQTLKSLLRSYCVELALDWEEGLPWLLMGVREVTQESVGFSPNDLVFGHEVRGPLAILAENWTPSEPSQNVLDYVSGFRYRLYEARAIAQRRLGKSQDKMEKLFNRKAVARKFQVGDQVLALLPLVSHPFQARFAGPFPVLKCLPGQNYLLKTPERRKGVQVCHVNLLKPYLSPVSPVVLTTVADDSSPLNEELISSQKSFPSSGIGEDGVRFPSRDIVEGRLNNSEMFGKLIYHLPHLSSLEKSDILKLVKSFPNLFSDVPSCTTVIEHDIDVGNALPIKQHAYRVNPTKRELLKREITYLLDNNLAEPSFSSWCSPCILVNKPDGSYRFCTDYRRLNSVTKPDCYPFTSHR